MNNDSAPTSNQSNPRKTAQLSPEEKMPVAPDQANAALINIQEQHDEQERKLKVFISYAHEDQELHKKLNEHLIPLTYSKNIEIWHDQEIPAGADWKDHIDTHLNEADVILLLVSSSFIASNYCWNEEVLAALKRHEAKTAKVVPIILKPVRWQNTPLGQLQALPTRAKPVTQWENVDAALEDVAQGIEHAVEDLIHGDGYRIKKIRDLWKLFISNVKTTKIVPTSDQGKRPLFPSLLLIGALLLAGYLLSVGLGLFNISLPSWISYVTPFLVIPFVLLLFMESREAQTSGMTKKRRAFLSLSAATIGLLALDSFIQGMRQLTQLRMGLLPDDLQNRGLFEDSLSNLLGVPVSSVLGKTYEETINALAKGNVEVGWLGAFSYLRARQKCGVRVILCKLSFDQKRTYQSYIIANSKANIHTVEDLKGKKFAFTEPNGTGGWLIPRYELNKVGFDLDKDIDPYYAGSFQKVLDKVLAGDIPAGAVSSDIYHTALGKGDFREGDLIILKKSRDIPTGPIVVRKDISHYDELRIEDAFLTVNQSIYSSMEIGGVAKAIDKDYDFLLDIAKDLHIKIEELN